jgi:hypothetical protein
MFEQIFGFSRGRCVGEKGAELGNGVINLEMILKGSNRAKGVVARSEYD